MVKFINQLKHIVFDIIFSNYIYSIIPMNKLFFSRRVGVNGFITITEENNSCICQFVFYFGTWLQNFVPNFIFFFS